MKQLNLPNVKTMTAVELYPGMKKSIRRQLCKLPRKVLFISIKKYLGLGAWTSALKDAGFKRVISLEPQAIYCNWMQVSIEGKQTGKSLD